MFLLGFLFLFCVLLFVCFFIACVNQWECAFGGLALLGSMESYTF